ncbi:MAG: arylesterase [Thermoanaerobaculia bacterium]
MPAAAPATSAASAVASPADLAKPVLQAPAAPAIAALPRIVFLGDSLTAGLGLSEAEAYPALVGKLLAGQGMPVTVVNAGVSGDTSAGGLARLDWLLTQKPDILFVALGANDGLRGQPVAGIAANLHEIVIRARAAGATVVLAGMRMPPNYGPAYTHDFEAAYRNVAKDLAVPLLPFLLEGVGGIAALNQADGIHPTAEGQRRVAAQVADLLAPVVRNARPRIPPAGTTPAP